jgi:hypothetical protein
MGGEFDYLLGQVVFVESETFGKQCPATIIGLPGEKTKSPLRSYTIPEDSVDIQYIEPGCAIGGKLLKIEDIRSAYPQPNTRHFNLWRAAQQREGRKFVKTLGQNWVAEGEGVAVEPELEPEPELQPEPPTAADPSAIVEQELEIGEFYKLDDRIVQYTGVEILRHGHFHPEIAEGEYKHNLKFIHYVIDISGELKEESIDKELSLITTLEKTEPSILCPIINESGLDRYGEKYVKHYINFNTTSRDLKMSDLDINYSESAPNQKGSILFVYPITDAGERELRIYSPISRFDIISENTNSKTPPFDVDREWGGNLLISEDSNKTTLKDLLRISTDSLKTQEILELLKKTLSENLFFIQYYEYMDMLLQNLPRLNEGNRMSLRDPRLNPFYKKHFPTTPEDTTRSAERREEAVERKDALHTKYMESRGEPQITEGEMIELAMLKSQLEDTNHKWGGGGKKRKTRKRKSKRRKSKKSKRRSRKSKTKRRR